MRASLTEVVREQWNFNITKGQGIGKISEICLVYVIPRFFSIYYTIQPMNYQQSVLAHRRLFTRGAVQCLSISGDTPLNSIMAYQETLPGWDFSSWYIYMWKVREICHLAIWEGLHVIKIFCTDVWKICDQEKKTTVSWYCMWENQRMNDKLISFLRRREEGNPKQFFFFYILRFNCVRYFGLRMYKPSSGA